MVETNDTTRPGKRGERSREEYVGRSLQLPQDQPPIDWSSPLGVGQRLRRIVDRHLEEKGQTEPGRKKLPVGLWKEITPLLPEEVRHAKPDTLRQGYNRAWDYLPSDYNQRVSAFQTWKKGYSREQARDLMDRLLACRQSLRDLLDQFPSRWLDHRARAIPRDGNYARNITLIERGCERIEAGIAAGVLYFPELRALLPDLDGERTLAELASGPQTRRQIGKKLGKTEKQMASIGVRLRKSHPPQIANIRRGGVVRWKIADTEPPDISTRHAIVALLSPDKKMTRAAIATALNTKSTTIKRNLALLITDDIVMRTEDTMVRTARRAYRCATYALKSAGYAPYAADVSTADATLEALPGGEEKTLPALAEETGHSRSSIQHAILGPLKGKVICTKRGNRTGPATYARTGTRPAHLDISDATLNEGRPTQTLSPARTQKRRHEAGR